MLPLQLKFPQPSFPSGGKSYWVKLSFQIDEFLMNLESLLNRREFGWLLIALTTQNGAIPSANLLVFGFFFCLLCFSSSLSLESANVLLTLSVLSCQLSWGPAQLNYWLSLPTAKFHVFCASIFKCIDERPLLLRQFKRFSSFFSAIEHFHYSHSIFNFISMYTEHCPEFPNWGLL